VELHRLWPSLTSFLVAALVEEGKAQDEDWGSHDHLHWVGRFLGVCAHTVSLSASAIAARSAQAENASIRLRR